MNRSRRPVFSLTKGHLLALCVFKRIYNTTTKLRFKHTTLNPVQSKVTHVSLWAKLWRKHHTTSQHTPHAHTKLFGHTTPPIDDVTVRCSSLTTWSADEVTDVDADVEVVAEKVAGVWRCCCGQSSERPANEQTKSLYMRLAYHNDRHTLVSTQVI